MIPLRDSVATNKRASVTWLLIAINVLVTVVMFFNPDPEVFMNQWALIGNRINFLAPWTWYPFITSQFLHAGPFHLLSNMWFLKIFGDNVEERLGHLKFLFFYLFWGIVAALGQSLFLLHSSIPMVGASGAIAGVLGAYLVFFPHHQVKTLVPLGWFWRVIDLPASIMLFYWFFTQVLVGAGSLAQASMGGVAYFAHIGGFGAGWLTARADKK